MKNTAYDYLMNGHFCNDSVYTVNYKPYSMARVRFKYFENLRDAWAWCNRQRGKVQVFSGSWQVLDMFTLEQHTREEWSAYIKTLSAC